MEPTKPDSERSPKEAKPPKIKRKISLKRDDLQQQREESMATWGGARGANLYQKSQQHRVFSLAGCCGCCCRAYFRVVLRPGQYRIRKDRTLEHQSLLARVGCLGVWKSNRVSFIVGDISALSF